MGGGGSSKSTSNTTNVSGQSAIQGDNLGASVSGVNNSTVTVQMSDYGAIDKATQLGELALTNTKEFASEALNTYSATNSENLQMMAALQGSQAEQNTKNLDAITSLASQVNDGGQVATTQEMTKVALAAGAVSLAVILMVGKK